MNRFNTRKRTLVASAIGIGALAATIALAQTPGDGAGPGYGPPAQAAGSNADWAQTRLERIAWRLNLTEEQKVKLKPIFEEQAATRAAQREAMRTKVAGVLTPAQLAQWDQMRGPKGRREPCGGKGFGPGRGYGQGMGYGPGPGVGTTN